MPENLDLERQDLEKKAVKGLEAFFRLLPTRAVGATTSQALYQFTAPPSDGFGILRATFLAGYTVKVKFITIPADDTYYLRLYKVTGNDLTYVAEYTTLTQIGNTTEYQAAVSDGNAAVNDNYAIILVKNQGAGQLRLPLLAIQVHIS